MTEPRGPAILTRVKYWRQWKCQVLASGFHNGAACGPGEPHGADWECGYVWHTPDLSDADMKAIQARSTQRKKGTLI
jgi:hypothetical protein